MRISRQDNYPKISINCVCRLMKQLNIKSIIIKKFPNYRQKTQKGSYKNLVNQVFTAAKPNQIWLSDITYIHTIRNDWTYLASALDICTRKIVGFNYDKKMNKSLVISALQNACNNQSFPKNIILHSDRGSQYAANDYIRIANKLGMKLATARKAVLLTMHQWNLFMLLIKKKKFIYNITKTLMKPN